MSSNMAARGTVWTVEETNDLILLWSDEKTQALLESARHNHKVFVKIGEALADKGYENRGGKQCQDKIKKLKMKYREILDHNNKSGRGRKSWEFFETMDRILGTKPTSRPQLLLQSAEDEYDEMSDDHDSESEEQDNSTSSISIRPRPSSDDRYSHSTEADGSLNEIMVDKSLEEDIVGDLEQDVPRSSTPKASKQRAPDRNNGPNKKKPKKNKTEKAVDSAIEKFTTTLKEMDENFLNLEREHQRKEDESKENYYAFIRKMEENRMQMEVRMREQDRNHEMRLFNMMFQCQSQQVSSNTSANISSHQNDFSDQANNIPSFSTFMPYHYEG